MSTLDKKLFRDLAHMWGQALAIALVVACGVATLVLARGAHLSLLETREAYYERYRFADLFSELKRAPVHLKNEIAKIPGVSSVETRIKSGALLDVEGYSKPATGLMISLPRHGEMVLNGLHMRLGRMPDPLRDEEVVLNAAFADAHNLAPGATLKATLNGRKKELTVVGTALSPEFIYALGPGDIVPDDKRFGIIWMGRTAAEAAFGLDGAFNEVSLRLRRDAKVQTVIERLDGILKPYGGTDAYERKDQVSHAFIDSELQQLETMSLIIPPVFLAVAAFLINMTLSRIIAMEREQIGLMKAIGYGVISIGAHYLKFAGLIAGIGILIGFGLGVWVGRGLTELYGTLFHFPFLVFQNPPGIFIVAGSVALGAALIGGARAVNSVLRLSPAVAMAPPVPTRYRHSWTEKIGLLKGVRQTSMMIMRHILRFPVRASLTVIGMASSGALLVMSFSVDDAMDHMLDVTYFQASRQDGNVSFYEIRPMKVIEDLRHLPGVLQVEPYRDVSATLRNGNSSKRMSVKGIPKSSDLERPLDTDLNAIAVPDVGIAISEKVAEILNVGLGESIDVETKEGHRRTFRVPVTAITQGYLGLQAFMELTELNRRLGDGRAVRSAGIMIDEGREDELYDAIKEMPAVSAIVLMKSSLQSFRDTVAEHITMMTTVYISLAMVITFGVVYNSARVQLSERGRELASMRVLGFNEREVSWILLGETAVLVALAIPLSWLFGYGFTWFLLSNFETELYRVPIVVDRSTYAYTAFVILIAAIVSALLVRRRIGSLNLIAVLKTRE